jgi:hypothetical protein
MVSATNSFGVAIALSEPSAKILHLSGSAGGSSAYFKAVDERVETPIGPIPPLTLRG